MWSATDQYSSFSRGWFSELSAQTQAQTLHLQPERQTNILDNLRRNSLGGGCVEFRVSGHHPAGALPRLPTSPIRAEPSGSGGGGTGPKLYSRLSLHSGTDGAPEPPLWRPLRIVLSPRKPFNPKLLQNFHSLRATHKPQHSTLNLKKKKKKEQILPRLSFPENRTFSPMLPETRALAVY